MPTPPSSHHQDMPWVPTVVDGLGSTGHADGAACEVGRYTGSCHHGAHPAGEGLWTNCMVQVVLTAGEGAPYSVAMLECRAGGARKVCLDRLDCTDLLLNIRMDGQLN